MGLAFLATVQFCLLVVAFSPFRFRVIIDRYIRTANARLWICGYQRFKGRRACRMSLGGKPCGKPPGLAGLCKIPSRQFDKLENT